MATIDPSPSADETLALATELKAVQNKLHDYIQSPAGKTDPNLSQLIDQDLAFLEALSQLYGEAIQILGQDAGKAVDTINHAVENLKAAVARRAEITRDVAVLTAIINFAVSIPTGQPAGIISTGMALVNALAPSLSPGGVKTG